MLALVNVPQGAASVSNIMAGPSKKDPVGHVASGLSFNPIGSSARRGSDLENQAPESSSTGCPDGPYITPFKENPPASTQTSHVSPLPCLKWGLTLDTQLGGRLQTSPGIPHRIPLAPEDAFNDKTARLQTNLPFQPVPHRTDIGLTTLQTQLNQITLDDPVHESVATSVALGIFTPEKPDASPSNGGGSSMLYTTHTASNGTRSHYLSLPSQSTTTNQPCETHISSYRVHLFSGHQLKEPVEEPPVWHEAPAPFLPLPTPSGPALDRKSANTVPLGYRMGHTAPTGSRLNPRQGEASRWNRMQPSPRVSYVAETRPRESGWNSASQQPSSSKTRRQIRTPSYRPEAFQQAIDHRRDYSLQRSNNQMDSDMEFGSSSQNKERLDMDPARAGLAGHHLFQQALASSDLSCNKEHEDETAEAKAQAKDFYKEFRAAERQSFQTAKGCVQRWWNDLTPTIRWRASLDLAELAKRENNFEDARELYHEINRSHPLVGQAWLEHAKMEEECGNMLEARKILKEALCHCKRNENLLSKAIRTEERVGDLTAARLLIADMRGVPIEKSWKIILEGALLEARAGRLRVARKVFNFLMAEVTWYGPIYYEAFRFEERNCNFRRAYKIIQRGLRELHRYGPLWFGAFRIKEKLEIVPDKPIDDTKVEEIRRLFAAASRSISKELVWKVLLEAAQFEDRLATHGIERGHDLRMVEQFLEKAKQCYVESVKHCPENLRWKIWLAGARTEAALGQMEAAQLLLLRALEEVPAKSKSQVLIECARLEERRGNGDKARRILTRARAEIGYEWKVYLESILLEIRAKRVTEAIAAAELALDVHSGAGRLWALLIQLKQSESIAEQDRIFRRAVREVPKSGEVWCEGARLHLNPLQPCFDLTQAAKYLDFAILFTPQYGDSFIERLRLEILVNCAKFNGDATEEDLLAFGYGSIFRNLFSLDDNILLRAARALCCCLSLAFTRCPHRRCLNADPNYGSLWFYCKLHYHDTALEIMELVLSRLVKEIVQYQALYLTALYGGDITRARAKEEPITRSQEQCTEDEATASDFSTALVEFNRTLTAFRPDRVMPERERKRLLGYDCVSAV